MNTNLKYILLFGSITILLTILAINYVDSLDPLQNPDTYTTNTYKIKTDNGHIVLCEYKEDHKFVYVIGCTQEDK